VTSGFEDFGDAFFRASVNGLTPYQPGKPVEDVQRELGLARVIKLASNEGPFGPFPAALESSTAIRTAASTGCTKRSQRGTPSPSTRSVSVPARTAASTC